MLILKKKISYLLNELRNFNEMFRKHVTYDNIKSHKKTGLHAFSEKHNFTKSTAFFRNTPLPHLFRVETLVVRQLMEQPRHSIYGDSNLVLFLLWLREAMPKPGKVSLCFVQDCTFI